MTLPVRAFRMRASPSLLAVTIHLPSGLNTAALSGPNPGTESKLLIAGRVPDADGPVGRRGQDLLSVGAEDGAPLGHRRSERRFELQLGQRVPERGLRLDGVVSVAARAARAWSRVRDPGPAQLRLCAAMPRDFASLLALSADSSANASTTESTIAIASRTADPMASPRNMRARFFSAWASRSADSFSFSSRTARWLPTPVQDRGGKQVVRDLVSRSVGPARWRRDRAQDAGVAAGQPLEQCVGLLGGAAGVFGEVGRGQGDLGSGRGDEMVEDVDGCLASLLGQVAESPVNVGPDDRLCPAEFLERLQAQRP